jgi:hypothetical protein
MNMEVRKIEFDGSDTGNKIYGVVNTIVLAAMAQNFNGNQVEAIGIGVSAVAGAIEGIAAIIGQREGIDDTSTPEEQASTVNEISTLVAALLVAKSTKVTRDENISGLHMELNPIVYLAAINAARSILGRDIDKQLNPGLVTAARRWEREHGSFGGWEDQTHEVQVGRKGSLH